jgi:hypothetical protein
VNVAPSVALLSAELIWAAVVPAVQLHVSPEPEQAASAPDNVHQNKMTIVKPKTRVIFTIPVHARARHYRNLRIFVEEHSAAEQASCHQAGQLRPPPRLAGPALCST